MGMLSRDIMRSYRCTAQKVPLELSASLHKHLGPVTCLALLLGEEVSAVQERKGNVPFQLSM